MASQNAIRACGVVVARARGLSDRLQAVRIKSMSRSRSAHRRPMATVYSTCDVHPRDSVAYWVEVVTQGFVKCAVTPSRRPSFQASVRSGSLGNLSVSTYECDPNEVTRGAREIARASSDDLYICLQLSGRSIDFQGDREAVIDSGSFFLLDPQRPFTGRSVSRGKLIAVGMPRQMLEARTGNVAVRFPDYGRP